MAQHDYSIANQAGLAFRADLNAALAAISSTNSGSTAPSTTYAGMLWLDTSATPPVLRRRNAANNGWEQPIALADVEGSASGITLRNKLLNANFAINQRSYVSGAATTGANQYTLDRWRVVTSGQNVTFTESGNSYQVTAPAGGFEQVIEGANMEAGVYTLSWTGTATATVNGVAISNGGQTSALSAGSNATVRFVGGTVLEPMFELGSVKSPFERPPVGLELMLCRRYARPLRYGHDFYASVATQTDRVTYPIDSMRAAPTVSGQSNSNSVNTQSINISAPSASHVQLSVTCNVAGNVGATGSCFLDAEL